VDVIVKAVTDYIARRMVEREQALATTIEPEPEEKVRPRRRGGFWPFLLGVVVGAAALFALALYAALHNL
jgi:hypothetical protein